jgi:SET domain-containing protein
VIFQKAAERKAPLASAMEKPTPDIEVRVSPIHGRGLFATRAFEPGELIGTYEGPRATENGTYVLWVEDVDGSFYGVHGENELRYLNHSSKPNADFDDELLYAAQRINLGDEICFHYGEDWEDIE